MKLIAPWNINFLINNLALDPACVLQFLSHTQWVFIACQPCVGTKHCSSDWNRSNQRLGHVVKEVGEEASTYKLSFVCCIKYLGPIVVHLFSLFDLGIFP